MKFMIGFLLGFLVSIPMWYSLPKMPDPKLELAAYRDCMERPQRCRMTPQDFIRYYEIKHQLEIEDVKTNTE